MKRNRKDLDAILDRVVAGIRSEEIDSATVQSAADRVWLRLSKEESLIEVPETKEAGVIRGCEDFQALMPAYLRKELSPARTLLLEDHTRECIPCRKALKAERSGSVQLAGTSPVTRKLDRSASQSPVWKWAIAATLVIGLALVAYNIYRRIPVGERATIQAANGPVYRVTDTESRALNVGEEVGPGERIRTAKGADAVVKLEDGSLVEMRERSEFLLSRNSDGTTIHLDRGNVIVEAAKQRGGHLYVATDDALVSVTGTIFSVNNGTKGSRVSVIEGEVHVNHAGDEKVLHPGDQTTTSASLEALPIQEEVAWSRNAERYAKLMTALTSLSHELDQKVPKPGVRYSTRLLDLVPDGTVVYAALPNLSATLVESHRIMQERIHQNAALSEWWQKERQGYSGPGLDQVIEEIKQFGKYLGTEIVASAKLGERGPEDPLVLAELTDGAG
ncbi:MAG TPA: FecR domain-containing protein, partial [Pyrinomonadaceae bacterium]|nr:FecR domain-containing protein [Pyrinomonadaceae bacterium]